MNDMAIGGFIDREFAVDELTEQINIVPNMYGLVTQLGIFPPPRPLSTTYFGIERQNWSLNLLPITERGGPGTRGTVGKRDRKIFEVPQITHTDEVRVADVQNLRAYGTAAPKFLADLYNEKLFTMAQKHFLTHEHQRLRMLTNGELIDADGSSKLNLFTEFGVTRPVLAFGEGSDSIVKRLRRIKRYMEVNLFGEMMTGVVALCSPEFMETLFADTEVKAERQAMVQGGALQAAMVISDPRSWFPIQGITFIEYNGTFSYVAPDGSVTVNRAIASGKAHFFPSGTMQMFMQSMAPGDFEEAHNMPGQLIYAKEKRDGWGRSREILTQSNLLPFVARPQLLVEGNLTNSGSNVP
jgi:hypothetical protein